MSYNELTPGGWDKYHESMDTQSSQESEENVHVEEVRPSPAQSLREIAESGREDTGGEKIDARDKLRAENRDLLNKRRTTQDYLQSIADEIQKGIKSPQGIGGVKVRAYADQLVYAARMLESKLKGKELEDFSKTRISEDVDQLVKAMDQARREIVQQGGSSEAMQAASARLDQAMLGHASRIAELAREMRPYFEKDDITQQEKDPYKPILSFEELMTKFVPVVEEKFRPGGEFALITITRDVDEFGREIVHEEGHPENFMQYIREKADFYHDFDPYKPINLFQNLYLTLGFRTASVYELLVDFPQYFYKRQDTYGDLEVTINDLERSEDFVKAEIPAKERGDIAGYYYFTDKSTKQQRRLVVRLDALDQSGRPYFYRVFEKIRNPSDGEEVEVPYQALVKDMDKRDTKTDPAYEYIKEALLYDVWLFNEWHNNNINYRQNGMPTESKLKEVMAEVCSVNILTHTRKRLLGDLRMPSVSNKQEMEAFKRGDFDKLGMQGSVGKAEQRAIALLYHLSEANAYLLDDKGKPKFRIEGDNPFEQLLRTEHVNAAQYFYKGLIRETITDQYKNRLSPVVAEFMKLVNGKKDEWQNLDLADLLLSGKGDLEAEVARRGKKVDFDTAVESLHKKYAVGTPERKALDILLNGSAQEKRASLMNAIGLTDESLTDHRFIRSSGLEGLEDFALKFLVSTFDTEYTADANVYAHINYDQRAKDRVEKAIRNAIQQTEQISGFEAKYAEERAFALSYFLGISARNDMNGIGHDAWSKMLNTEFYRASQTSGKNYAGNLHNLFGIHRLGVDMLQGLRVQPAGSNKLSKTLYEEITGFNGTDFSGINKPIELFDFHGNAMRQYYADHLSHVIDLFVDITQKHEFNFDKIITIDQVGRIVVKHDEMQKLIDNTWKHLRYGFDNRSFLYDNKLYGWWYDEKINPQNGQVSRTPHFGAKTLRDLMFSKEVLSLRMYEREDVSGWKPGSDRTRVARNIFAYLIKAQFEEHVKWTGHAELYTADQISMIASAFMEYSARVMRGEHGEAISLSGFFTQEEMWRILVMAHAVLWKLYSKEYGADMFGGFFSAILQAMSILMKEAGSGITLKHS